VSPVTGAQTIDAATTGVQQAIDAAFATTARRWERILTVVRVVLCAVMFVRSALIWSFAPDVVGPIQRPALEVSLKQRRWDEIGLGYGLGFRRDGAR
jgi:hypothetical protein